jgi:hypothetical protein
MHNVHLIEQAYAHTMAVNLSHIKLKAALLLASGDPCLRRGDARQPFLLI